VRARLIETTQPAGAHAAVLVLHGGASRRGEMMVSPTQLSVLRMIPVARHIARRGGDRLAVFRLLNSSRGRDTRHPPVHDVRWALGELADRLGPTFPVGLVGHSLGGRAAILASDAPAVGGVVALAPWVWQSDAAGLSGSAPVVVVHGTAARIAPPDRAHAVVAALAMRRTAAYVGVSGARHAMLRRHRVFSTLAGDVMAATLLGQEVGGVVGRALAGEEWQTV
jgi:dienelactone hydrolase